MKVSKHHKWWSLKTTDSSKNCEAQSRTFCKKHKNKEVEIVCEKCKKLLCVTCMTKDHQGHTSRELTDVALEVREKLQTILQTECFDERLVQQDAFINSLKETRHKLESSLDSEIQTIRDQGANLHRAVDEAIKKMEEEVAKKYAASRKENEEFISVSETAALCFKLVVVTAHAIVEQASDVDIIEEEDNLCKELKNVMNNYHVDSENINDHDTKEVFIKGELDLNVIENMVGKVNDLRAKTPMTKAIPSLSSDRHKVVKVGSIIVADGRKDIKDIAKIRNNRAWICFWGDAHLLQVDSTGMSVSCVNIGVLISAIASDPKDNCIMSCYDKSIKRVNIAEKIEVIVADTDGDPQAVAYRKKSDRSEEVLFSCTDTSRGDSTIFVAPYRVGSKTVIWSSGHQSIHSIAVDSTTNRVYVADSGDCTVISLDENGHALSKFQNGSNRPFNCCFGYEWGLLVTNNNAQLTIYTIRTDGARMEKLTQIRGFTAAVGVNGCMWVGMTRGVVQFYELRPGILKEKISPGN